MTLSELILTYMKEHSLTYEMFAKKCGLSKGYISMIVRSRNPRTGKAPIPTIDTYSNIASAMGLTIKELLEITESDTPTYLHVVSTQHAPDELRLLNAYNRAMPIIREAALKMLEDNPDKQVGEKT